MEEKVKVSVRTCLKVSDIVEKLPLPDPLDGFHFGCQFCGKSCDSGNATHYVTIPSFLHRYRSSFGWEYCQHSSGSASCAARARTLASLWHNVEAWNTYVRPLCMRLDEATGAFLAMPEAERKRCKVKRSTGDVVEDDWVADTDFQHCMLAISRKDPMAKLDNERYVVYPPQPSPGDASVSVSWPFKILMKKLDVGSSRVDLQACKLEYSIVSPK